MSLFCRNFPKHFLSLRGCHVRFDVARQIKIDQLERSRLARAASDMSEGNVSVADPLPMNGFVELNDHEPDVRAVLGITTILTCQSGVARSSHPRY